MRRGTSLIDLLISIGIIALLFGGIYLVYFSILTSIGNINVRTAASAAISSEIETIRNLPYASVGTVGGVPAGVIPQTQAVAFGNYSLSLHTTILSIDDPFDGTVNGNPLDFNPNDYKLVSIEATCAACDGAFDELVTTTVAPKNLESATAVGTLILSALDANGNPLSQANVHLVNASVTPSIDFTDTTNASGILEVIGVPTSSQNYAVTVTKAGYSTDRTYTVGAPSNPDPLKPHLSALAQTVTNASFAIDRLSSLTVYSSDNRCNVAPSEPFSLKGSKIIGVVPQVLKFSTSSITAASGSVLLQNLEWDAYSFRLADNTKDLVGTIPLSPMAVDPSSTANFRFVVQDASDPSFFATVIDSGNGAGIPNASVALSKSGFSQTLVTNHATLFQDDWSGSGETGYSSESGGIHTGFVPGPMVLATNASGTYATSTQNWLISNTFDVGGANSTFFSISWNPTSELPQTGVGSLEFQVAANNDDATWNFVGSDGTGGTFFTTAGNIPAALSGKRYFRYKVFMSTQDENYTPELDDVSIDFVADCVPSAQVIFSNLPQGTYTVDVTAQNYAQATSTIVIGAGVKASSTISLTHL